MKAIIIHLIWAAAIASSFLGMIYGITQATISGHKQEAFMMESCVKNGGAWLLKWNNIPYCAKTGERQ